MQIKIIGSLLFLLSVLQLYIFGAYDVLTTLTHYSDALSGELLLLINFAVIAISVALFFWDIK